MHTENMTLNRNGSVVFINDAGRSGRLADTIRINRIIIHFLNNSMSHDWQNKDIYVRVSIEYSTPESLLVIGGIYRLIVLDKTPWNK